MLQVVNIQNWVLIHWRRDGGTVQSFAQVLSKAASSLGMRVSVLRLLLKYSWLENCELVF